MTPNIIFLLGLTHREVFSLEKFSNTIPYLLPKHHINILKLERYNCNETKQNI